MNLFKILVGLIFYMCCSPLFAQHNMDLISDNLRIGDGSVIKQKYVRIFDEWESFHKIEVNGNYCYKIVPKEGIVRDSLIGYFTEEEKQSLSIEVKDFTLFLTSNYKSDVIDSLGMGEKTDTIYLVVKKITHIFGFGHATIYANLMGDESSYYHIKIQGVSEFKGDIAAGEVDMNISDASIVSAHCYIEKLRMKMNNGCEMYLTGYAGKSLFLLKSRCLLDIVNLSMSDITLSVSDKSKIIMSKHTNTSRKNEEANFYIDQRISSDSELLFK